MIPSMAGSRTYVGPAYYDSRQPVTLKVLRVRSSENIANILTKALCPNDFARLRSYLGIRHARVA